MRIGEEDVVLPGEDPIGYALDWRSRIVEDIIASGRRGRLPKVLGSDQWVRDYLAMRRERSCTADRRNAISMAIQWHESEGLRPVIDALLLSGASYSVIGTNLGDAPTSAVEAYSALFFDVRDEEGELRTPHLLRLRFEREDTEQEEDDRHVLWRRAALTGGYPLLQLLWGNFSAIGKAVDSMRPDELVDLLVEQEVVRRLLAGELQPRDLIRMQGTQVARERMRFDTGEHSSHRDEGWNFVGAILQMLAPRRAPLHIPDDDHGSAMLAKLKAESNIRAEAIEEVSPVFRTGGSPNGGTLLPEEIAALAATGGRPADG